MSLEYILIYQQDGNQIFSSCLSGFCQTLVKDRELLDEMLVKLSNVPKSMVKNDTTINKYSIKDIDFHFYTDGTFFLVFGFSNGKIQQEVLDDTANKILTNISEVVSEDESISNKINDFMSELIDHTLHKFVSEENNCLAGEQCPLENIDASKAIWDELSKLK